MSTSFFKPATAGLLDDLNTFAERNNVEVIISECHFADGDRYCDIFAIPLIEDDEERLAYIDDVEFTLDDARRIAAQCDLPEQEV